jgi:hypothetical protein
MARAGKLEATAGSAFASPVAAAREAELQKAELQVYVDYRSLTQARFRRDPTTPFDAHGAAAVIALRRAQRLGAIEPLVCWDYEAKYIVASSNPMTYWSWNGLPERMTPVARGRFTAHQRAAVAELLRQGLAPSDAEQLLIARREGCQWYFTANRNVRRQAASLRTQCGLTVTSPMQLVHWLLRAYPDAVT